MRKTARAVLGAAKVVYHGFCIYLLYVLTFTDSTQKHILSSRVEFLFGLAQIHGSYFVGAYLELYELVHRGTFERQLNEIKFIIPDSVMKTNRIKHIMAFVGIFSVNLYELLKFKGNVSVVIPYYYGLYCVLSTSLKLLTLNDATVNRIATLRNSIKEGVEDLPRVLSEYVEAHHNNKFINSIYSPALIVICVLFFVLMSIQTYFCISSFVLRNDHIVALAYLANIIFQCFVIIIISNSGEMLKNEERLFNDELLTYSLSLQRGSKNDGQREERAKYQDLIELHLMSNISMAMTVSEFANVDRKLFLGMIGASFTYVIVIIQLKGLSLSENE